MLRVERQIERQHCGSRATASAGVLVKLGRSEITIRDFEMLLSGQCTPKLDVPAWTAPASGLFLEGVRYPDAAFTVRR